MLLLCCTSLCRYCISQVEDLWQLYAEEVYCQNFFNSLLPGSVLHFGNSHSVSIFDCYQYSSYGDL